ncbi:hypothetical protein AB1Y20_004973 [Prymnesium parvum]|uniref:G-protein coupled receptors family 2 profile 2 domain-containing protein n=1 Tax=Prymnesium parvum TaxID=97485 RepID=A0AB34J2G0_PRYPA|mmetsp:Transcript_27943/g.67711  ORF Transcript_27943/g.67711 Transcript_27943/m.67711 type:complete len:369 (-) Transcript_27943:84-1190(-)
MKWGRPVYQSIRDAEEMSIRYVYIGSAFLSLLGAGVIFFSVLRFRELSKRFFAIRLILFLTVANTLAALLHVAGSILDLGELVSGDTYPTVCKIQAVGLVYFNLASIMWTSCFAFTLYRDIMRAYRRQALRTYEVYFHGICWPLPVLPAGVLAWCAYKDFVIKDVDSWCSIDLTFSKAYLIYFYCPVTAALAFNLLIYTAVIHNSGERRVSRTTSLYLLGFAVVWTPSLISRLLFMLAPYESHSHVASIVEALCSPLQGALNALVYGWSLPSIRDVYRKLLLGEDEPDLARADGYESSGRYSPPDNDAALPQIHSTPCGWLSHGANLGQLSDVSIQQHLVAHAAQQAAGSIPTAAVILGAMGEDMSIQ